MDLLPFCCRVSYSLSSRSARANTSICEQNAGETTHRSQIVHLKITFNRLAGIELREPVMVRADRKDPNSLILVAKIRQGQTR
jgi:hypothetical protein